MPRLVTASTSSFLTARNVSTSRRRSGEVVTIDENHLKVTVLVNIFGRETPVELDFAQVAKL